MKNVAVIFGSRSAEHDISIITAISSVIEPLKLTGLYNPVPVYIAKSGRWYSDDKLSDVNFYVGGDVDNKLAKLKEVNLKFDDGLWLIKPGLGGEKIKADIVFPATHGTYGEDGSLMGLLRMADVPFVGCDLQASVVAMDKALTKIVVQAAGMDTPKFEVILADEFKQNLGKAVKQCQKLTKPLFVKPAHLGSSIAITRAKNNKQLKDAIELAFYYDDKIVVEEAVKNLVEVTVPIYGNRELTVGMVEEALNRDGEFFDFETKYMQGGKKGKGGDFGDKGSYSRMPAKISKQLLSKSEDVAKQAFRAIDGSGIARVDLLIDKKAKKVYVNEINPLPGSLYFHNWKKAGISNVELVGRLVEIALERYQQQKQLNRVFETSFLKQF